MLIKTLKDDKKSDLPSTKKTGGLDIYIYCIF